MDQYSYRAILLLLELRLDDTQELLDELPNPGDERNPCPERTERLRWRYQNQIRRLDDAISALEVSTWSKEP